MKNMLHVLFVCTGNTCRSPMAKAILNKTAKENKLDIIADSAGLAAFPGDEASENAVRALSEIGIDLSSHRSKPVNQYMLDQSDYIIAMSQSHIKFLEPYAEKDKLLTLLDGIPDPYGGDIEIYRLTRDKIKSGIESLLPLFCEVKIKPLCEKTVDAVAELEKECFSVPWSRKSISDELTNDTAHFFTAERFNNVIGYIGTNIIADECYITNVAVTANERRKGVGLLLLKKAEETAKKHSCRFISLEVRKNNKAAISLYLKQGFKECGLRKNYYTAPDDDGLIMTKFFCEE
ncbi:MAG: ribosomal protein S18-alanine N-acetyltransferase [Acutalibacteraceae bacterium]